MRSITYTILIFISLCLGLDKIVSIESQTRFILAGEINDSLILGYPVLADSYQDGSFVIHEYRDYRIKHFDKDGNFLRMISGRGRGPGEFLDIRNIYINDQDELLVVDHVQAMLTKFDPDFKPTVYNIFSTRPDIRPRSFHQKPDGSYIIGYAKPRSSYLAAPEVLFYELTENFGISENGFVTRTDLFDEESGSVPDLMIGRSFMSENSILTLSGDLVVVPRIYKGLVNRYKRDSNYASFEHLKTKNYDKPYDEFTGKLPDSSSDPSFVRRNLLSMVSNSRGRKIFYILNTSLGLFRFNSGEIVHFVQEWNEGEKLPHLIVEILNPDASEVLAIERLHTLGDLQVGDHITQGNRHSIFSFQLLHMDSNNNLFVSVEGRGLEPELHVVSLQLKMD